MIIYNVTVNIDHSVHDEWLQWMKEKHIPAVLATGCFIENKICKIHAESEGGVSYSIQYLCKDMETYELYKEKFASELQKEHTEKYAGKFAAFRTILEVVYQKNCLGDER